METRLPSVTVHNPRQQHYHRAGFRFVSGKTELSAEQLTKDALAILHADPHIRVTENPTDELSSKGGCLDSESLDNALALDLRDAPEELAHIIAVMYASKPDAKPNCADLTCHVQGVGEVTPSAAERDAAWKWYQENVVKVG
ncbi:hypothetical protein N473_06915 [Pseudoalteromonas luteoviolacea CPMOR-1]|uniref:Uncharacterized protein n=1 Tax=Pseudoalteromonas luteoviolacea CPMOR-1 TaxID=1365248 RepID=A0A167H3X2_9GAMM|nr:HI1506-related protein [Pseudoalteromonas luteoviolacea]KZN57604.1 hypothetical protein N473_06915 [Pseudoalteromonas luteoviolacea CPMOR-1]